MLFNIYRHSGEVAVSAEMPGRQIRVSDEHGVRDTRVLQEAGGDRIRVLCKTREAGQTFRYQAKTRKAQVC